MKIIIHRQFQFLLFLIFVLSHVHPVFSFERNYDTQHIKLQLTFQLPEKLLSGKATLTIVPLESKLTTIKLHAKQLDILSILLNEADSLSFTTDLDVLQITLPRAYSTSEKITISIHYTCQPSSGLHFNAPNAEDPDCPVQIYSHSEPIAARTWFPCYDAPDDKVTSEIVATVPDSFFLLSNGRLVSTRHNAHRRKRIYHWLQDKPHSSYLISLVAGEYVEIADRYKSLPLFYYVYPGQEHIAANTFENTPKMIGIFERLFGHPFPWNKYAQIIIHNYQAAGMEHTGATSLYDKTIHDDRAHLDQDSDDLVSHELAHQWFGNLVTCSDWPHVWLNEGFATYAEILYKEFSGSPDEADYAVFKDQKLYLEMADPKFHQPIFFESYHHPEEMFNAIEYQKAGQVLHMLRYVVGDSVFFASLKNYLSQFAFGTATTADFIHCVEQTAHSDLEWFFDQWIFKGGHPIFSLKTNWDGSTGQFQLFVEQTQQDSLGLVPLVFTMPVTIELADSAGRLQQTILVDSRRDTFSFQLNNKPTLVLFDSDNRILKEVTFYKTQQEWIYQLQHHDHVAARLSALQHLPEATFDTSATAQALERCIGSDPFWAVRKEAAYLFIEFNRPSSKIALEAACHDPDARVRAAAVMALGTFNDKKYLPFFRKIARTDSSYTVVANAIYALSHVFDEQSFDFFAQFIDMDSDDDAIRSAAFHALQQLRDERAVPIAVRFAQDSTQSSYRRFSALSLLNDCGIGNARAEQLLIELLAEDDLHLKKKAITILGSFKTEKALNALQSLQSASLPEDIQRRLRISIQKIERTARTN
ncbi:MAG: M1 family aminopeptidase [Candidatus Zhuqueibacterota bacterium]